MKKYLILLSLVLLISTSFAQRRIDNDSLYQNTQNNFAVYGTSWDHRFLTYYFLNTTNDVSAASAKTAVVNAFNTWQAKTHIYFIETCDPLAADIRIGWYSLDHGDGIPFAPQPFGDLGHAFFPPPYMGNFAGDIHFNESYTWTTSITAPDTDIESVALHEIGHALGLKHSSVANAVMSLDYAVIRRSLTQDDINGIGSIYGAPINVISGPSVLTGPTNYTIAEPLPAGYHVTWTANNPCINISTTFGSPTASISNNGFSGIFTITAFISNGCSDLTYTKEVQTTASSVIISGPNVLCASLSGQYTLSNLPCNATVTWSITNADGSVTAATVNPTGNPTTVNVPSSGQSSHLLLTATLSGNTSGVFTKTIFVGPPSFSATYKNGVTDGNFVAIYFPNQGEYFNDVCIGYNFPNTYVIAQPYGTNNVIWSVPNGYASTAWSYQQTGNRADFYWNRGGTTPPAYLQVYGANTCGSFSEIFAFKQVNCGTPGGDPCAKATGVKYFTVSPNPANNYIKIGVGNFAPPIQCNKMQSLNSPGGITFSMVNIYNNLGTIVKSYKTKNAKEANIQISNLITGSYTAEISSGDYVEKHQIIVQK